MRQPASVCEAYAKSTRSRAAPGRVFGPTSRRNTAPSGPAAVEGDKPSIAAWRAKKRWFIRARMRQASCARSPGNTRAALAKSRACALGAPPLAFGEEERKGTTGRPRRPKIKPGTDFACLLGCLRSEDVKCREPRCRAASADVIGAKASAAMYSLPPCGLRDARK